MLLGDKRAYVKVLRSAKSLRRRRDSYIATGGLADAAMEVVLTADNNHTLLGTLVLEDVRLMATPSPADPSPVPRDYDDRGATMYAVAVILVYGFSIVLLIASHTYMKRKNGKRGDGEDMSPVTKYLEQVPHLQEISRKDSFRRLKMSIIPMVSIAIGRDITEIASKPVVPPTPPRSPIASLIHSIHDRLATSTTDDVTTPTSPTLKSVRFDVDNEVDPFGASTYTPLIRSLSHRSETSGGGRDGAQDAKDLQSHTRHGAGEGAGGVGKDINISPDRQTVGVSHVGGGGGTEGALVGSAGVGHVRTATGGIEDSERKVEPGAQAIPEIGVKLPAAMPYVRLLSTSSGVSSTVSAYTDQSSPCSPSSTSSFPYNLADSYSSGVASELQASSASNRLCLDGELLPPPSGTTRHHSPVAALPGVHQPKLLIHVPVQEPVTVVPPGGRWSNYPQRQVVQVGGAAQGEEGEEEPLVPLQITTV